VDQVGSHALGRPTPRRFSPPLLDNAVPRQRVADAIRAAAGAADLVVLVAGSGAGKSTAAAQAVANLPKTAWLNLDQNDQGPTRLVAHLDEALAAIARRPRPARRAGDLVPIDVIETIATAGAVEGATLVLDGIERLARSEASWAVLENLLRFATPGLRIIALGHRGFPAELCPLPGATRLAALPPTLLDFDEEETASLVRALGLSSDPGELRAATAGWAAALRWAATADETRLDHLIDGLLAGLAEPLRAFLIRSAVLPEVTLRAARTARLPEAGARIAELTLGQIPGVRAEERGALHYAPVLRRRLQLAFDRLPTAERNELGTRVGREMLRRGRTEEAVGELLRAGAVTEVRPIAEAALITVLDRGELDLAESWLDHLHAADLDSDGVVTAELMLAIARDDYRCGMALLDRLVATGRRDSLARNSDRAAAMMAWCYLHQGRPNDLAEIAHLTKSVALQDAIAYAACMISDPSPDSRPPQPPPLSGEPADALVLITDYTLGRSDFSHADQVTEWVRIVSQPGRIAALRAAGQLGEALREHDDALANGTANLAYRVYMGPELLIDAGLHDAARAAVDEGRQLAEATGSVGYRALNAAAAAKFHLRLGHDPEAARRVIDEAQRLIRGREFRLISGVLDTWNGLALLLQGVNLAAAKRLRRATEGMLAGHRMLELPIAATYLSEAEWRLGDEVAADHAAELALRASEATGSNHQLIRALRDFPEVVSRRIDAMRTTDTAWHALGRALLYPEAPVTRYPAICEARIHVADFERAVLEIDAEPVHPRLNKSCELLAFLALRPSGAAPREEVLAALFEGRTGSASSGYLRQACHQIRQVLPDPALLRVDAGWIAVKDSVVLTADSTRFEALLNDARRLSGAERVDLLAEAFALCRDREFLPGTDSMWAVRRRQELLDQAATARFDAADLCFRLGRLDDAAQHTRVLLDQDPYHEEGWRLQMRIAAALGSSAGVLQAYRRCAAALAELDTTPTTATRALLEQLRR
jgi:ATP/maltotriose-dependent transcriptional regulator MalT/DNA-binding SARP family transcriptional activator